MTASLFNDIIIVIYMIQNHVKRYVTLFIFKNQIEIFVKDHEIQFYAYFLTI